ncbi:hypothetical protein [Burkholderia pseudomallei]|uniref:hypothetical protein n=1 Tax=Burkholderia pseudomallei TaxID=28450 RepID=UPI000A1A284E|nr:hypothetical protein [Burkholderia pseudomallei]ARL04283.1 hypothetical protein BOC44_21170 [Burkholderia pseudomallei]
MGVQLDIELTNAAFDDGNRDTEVARIIREIADRLESEGPALPSGFIIARDVNGNRVGDFSDVEGDSAKEPDASSYVMLHIADLDNAAFEDQGPAFEVARIFRDAAQRIESGTLEFSLRDINGNRVGSVSAQIEDLTDELDEPFGVGVVEQYSRDPVYGDLVTDRFGNEWTVGSRDAAARVERDPVTGHRRILDAVYLISEDGADTIVERGEADLLKGMKESVRTLEYVIDLDERGEFAATVREQNANVIYRVTGFQIFEDGFMRDKHDLDGLGAYLKSLNILNKGDKLLDTNRFQEWEREIDKRFARALAEYEKSDGAWYGAITTSDSQRALLGSIGVELMLDPSAKNDEARSTYLVRMTADAHTAYEPYASEITGEKNPNAGLYWVTDYAVDNVDCDQFDDKGLTGYIACLKFKAAAANAYYVDKLQEAVAHQEWRANLSANPEPSQTAGSDHGNEP